MATVSDFPVVFAADITQIIFAAVVFVIYIVGHVLSAKDEAKAKPRRNRPPVAPVGDPEEPVLLTVDELEKAQRRAPPDQAEALRAEIEDFVRRAQGKPPQHQQSRPKPQAARQPVGKRHEQSQQPGRVPQLQQESPRRQEPQSRPVVRTPLREEGLRPQLEPRSDGVAEHVAKHLGASQVGDHAEQLGGQLSQVDERVEKRLQSKFDHQVGRLAHAESATETKVPTHDVAGEIAAMLRSPVGMRQLIIANEILRRPDWK